VEHLRDKAEVNAIALGAAATRDDQGGLGWTHHRMARVSSAAGRYDAAIASEQQALAHFGKAGNLGGESTVLKWLAGTLDAQERYREALEIAEQAVESCQRLEDRGGEAFALAELGWLQAKLGDFEKGRDTCQLAIDQEGGGLAALRATTAGPRRMTRKEIEAIVKRFVSLAAVVATRTSTARSHAGSVPQEPQEAGAALDEPAEREHGERHHFGV
jgi:tetratricopeptide (TPR) repeat protein